MDKEFTAELYATEKHSNVNQSYDGLPYTVHLRGVVKIAKQFIHLIPENDREDVIAGCWVHDVLEDTHETYNDIKKVLGFTVAEYSYALTNEKGRTRAERANDKYYAGIKAYKHATFIKMCDRLANSKYSRTARSSMYKKYKDEYFEFYEKLYDHRYQELWDELAKIYTF